MTEHIVNLAIGFDDDAIRKSIMDGAEKKIINDLKADVLTSLFESKYYSNKVYSKDHWSGEISLDNNAVLKEFALNVFKTTVEEYKDAIIDRAVAEIVSSIKRSKAFKQKYGEAME